MPKPRTLREIARTYGRRLGPRMRNSIDKFRGSASEQDLVIRVYLMQAFMSGFRARTRILPAGEGAPLGATSGERSDSVDGTCATSGPDERCRVWD